MGLHKLTPPAALMGLGAGLAYLFDPDQGRTRRSRLRDQWLSRSRKVLRRAGRQARYTEGRLDGVAARAAGAGTYTPQGDTHLREHLRQVIAESELPTTDVNVDVHDGVATLRGQLRTPEQIKELRSLVAAVPGVVATESFLHLPNTPAPNKADAIDAR